MVAILESAIVVVGGIAILDRLEEMGHCIHSLAKKVVHLLEHVAVRGNEENGGEGVLYVV